MEFRKTNIGLKKQIKISLLSLKYGASTNLSAVVERIIPAFSLSHAPHTQRHYLAQILNTQALRSTILFGLMGKTRKDDKSDDIEIISIGKLYNGAWDKKYWSSSRVWFYLSTIYIFDFLPFSWFRFTYYKAFSFNFSRNACDLLSLSTSVFTRLCVGIPFFIDSLIQFHPY